MKDELYFDLLKDNLFNIYDGEITFVKEDEKCPAKGNIIFQTSPYPKILMEPQERDEPLKLNVDVDTFPYGYDIQSLKNHSFKLKGSNTYYDEKENTVDDYEIFIEQIKTIDTELDEIIIYIMNCNHVALTYMEESVYHFEYDNWVIDFKFRPDKNIESHYDNLRKSRGYDITHVGSISKKNKEPFQSSEIGELIKKLEWYLSFCSAQSVFIPIQIGYKNESKVWENYVIKDGEVAHFQDNYGWVPLGAIEDFNKFFTNVATKLSQELWKDVLEIVLNWYIEITGNGMMENKIISTQIALEQLAWTYLVNQEEMLDKEAYKKLRATDILRLLCYQLNIPRDIVSNYAEDLIKKYNNDGVYMFVDFRNNLVHPDKKANTYQSDNTYTVYVQGLYFLEKALTKICGYEGEYKTS